ncbi:putative protein kinase RLK-Pelle-LRR-XII-1 family [Helianthus anomalus]
MVLFLCCMNKKKSKNRSPQSSADGRFLKVSYNQLFKATNGFSEANLIVHGGFSLVYKGILDTSVDRFVAVKVLHLQNQGAQKSFIRECEAWRKIRHRNVLKMITSFSSADFQSNDFKALIYEFMPNGSLHDLLHSSENISRLNLLQIINIFTIFHLHLITFIIIVCHPLFMYGIGSVMTCTGDVYSFGILVLEVMTGKKPTDNIFNEGLGIHQFASLALQDCIINQCY